MRQKESTIIMTYQLTKCSNHFFQRNRDVFFFPIGLNSVKTILRFPLVRTSVHLIKSLFFEQNMDNID